MGRTVRKSARLYVLWTLFYLPVTLLVFFLGSRSWYMDALVFIRGFLFVGEQAYSWTLWYLLATVVAVFLIGVALRCRVKVSVIFAAGIVLTVLGWWLQQALDACAGAEVQPLFLKLYRMVFGSTRNGVFCGLGCVAAGMAVWRFRLARRRFLPLQVLLILVGGGGLAYFKLPCAVLASSVGLFCVVLQWNLNGSPLFYRRLRTLSILIYFTHMYFVAGLSFLMKVGRFDLGLYATWGVLLVLDLLFSLLLLYFSERPSGRWLERLL